MSKLTKEQVKFFIETMTDDMHNTTQHEIAETLLSKFDECESLQAKLLAYEQAAKNPVAYRNKFTGQFFTLEQQQDAVTDTDVYEPVFLAAPVLHKQPVMFIDGDISSDDAEKLAAVIRELGNEPAPAQPVIPERPELRYGDNVLWFLNELAAFDASDIDSDDFDVYGEDRNGMEGCATISITELAADAAKLLSAQPVIEPKPLGYFSYGSEHGFDWHKTEKEAIESAEAAIDDYRGDACDGWSEETDSVCWSVILQQATKVDERPRADDDKCDPAIDTVCDYALLPEQESE